jgi:2-hydroxychromene-2-carboxylate isomerase
VARSARKTLLEAAFVTRIGEDVLTEMLAHVLVTDDDVTAGVAEAVGLDGEKWRAERVSTQESRDCPGRRGTSGGDPGWLTVRR